MENNIIDDTWKQVPFKSLKGKPVNNLIKNVMKPTDRIWTLRKTKYFVIGIINGKEVKNGSKGI